MRVFSKNVRSLPAAALTFCSFAVWTNDLRSQQSAPAPAAEAAARMTLPQGFRATLFAGEPDCVQPIATAFDDRGRLWVAECLSYPNWVSDPKQGRDRIVIFEDQNGDGKFSKKTIFAENIQNISGLEIGRGGVWVCATPNLIFIPIDESGDRPAGPPQILLDGWNLDKAQHNVFNRLVFGPDGWLYGCNGIQSHSLVGKPGAPAAERIPMNCGVFRFHPTKRIFEVFAHGTTNPWGLDFDEYGEAFITNCVIEHLFHVVPGSRFKRMYGNDFNKHAYGLMQTCADHIHWAGGAWQDSRSGEAHGAAGGGHAHAGCMIYLGDNWPDEYRNNVFMCNIHGNRLNRDLLERKGSGYVARHGKDFLLANDSWFRGLNLVYGPDGGVFVQDWTDTGECHNYKVVDRTNGRLFKIVYGSQPKPVTIDVAKLSDAKLVELQTHKNDWYVRRARLQLAERAAKGKVIDPNAVEALRVVQKSWKDVPGRLRALWALHAIGDAKAVEDAAVDADTDVLSSALRLMADDPTRFPRFGERLTAAAKHDSPRVRMAAASAMQRAPVEMRKPAFRALATRTIDAADLNLTLMVWYAAAPCLVEGSIPETLDLISAMKNPTLREFTGRLFAERGIADFVAMTSALAEKPGDSGLLEVIRGAQAAMKDVKLSTPPQGWAEAAAKLARNDDREFRRRTLSLSIAFGDPASEKAAMEWVNDRTASSEERRELLGAIVARGVGGLEKPLLDLTNDSTVGDVAIRGLASLDDAKTSEALFERYKNLPPSVKRAAVSAFASRPKWAAALVQRVKSGAIPKSDVDSLAVRQLANLKDAGVAKEVAALWGSVRTPNAERTKLASQYRSELAPAALKNADLPNGRLVYTRVCGQCHTLFDSGGKLGPDLTGSQRANLDYVLDNTLDPSAIVAGEYKMTILELEDGRTLTGVVADENESGLTLKSPTENVRLRKADVLRRSTPGVSIMPEGALQGLSPKDRLDLVAYLASPSQVPLPKGK
jgi:putative membrane-bound dehydrogenase-like protein